QEPDGLGAEEYVAHCLDVARRHEVSLFLPGRHVLPILRNRARFEALGVRVVTTADADGMMRLNHKAAVYAALADEPGVRIPDHAIVNDLAGFDAAWERLRARHRFLCYKPAVSVYGIGFH